MALSLDGSIALGFFGVPHSGKSYAMGAVVEMALQHVPMIGALCAPLCVVSLHHHPTASYEPELLAGVRPNENPAEVYKLLHGYRALPEGLRDVVILTVPEQVAPMRRRHPHVQVHGIRSCGRV